VLDRTRNGGGRLPSAATTCFAVALAAAVAQLFVIDSRMGFIADDWELLVKRPRLSAASLLDSFHEHLIVLPALVYKGLLATFGMTSALPFFVVLIALFALTVVLVYVYLRARVGPWLALFGVLPLLFLGAAYEDLLWAFQITFFGSIAAGMGMLIALDRGKRRSDQIASALLLVSLACSGLGVAFAAAAVVHVALGADRRARAYVALVPLAAYALWWIGWWQEAGAGVGHRSLGDLPAYVFNAAASGVAALLGTDPSSGGVNPPLLFQLLAAVLLIGAVVWVVRERSVSRGLAVVAALGLAFWLSVGWSGGVFRGATASRYLFPSATFVLLIAAELARGVRPSRLATAALALLAAVGAFGGIRLLDREDGGWQALGDGARSRLAAIDVAGATVGPGYEIDVVGTTISVGQYRRAAAAHGSPAFDEAELLADPDEKGTVADGTLVDTREIILLGEAGPGLTRCRVRGSSRAPAKGTPFPPGRFRLVNAGTVSFEVKAGRFGPPSSGLGRLGPGQARTISISADSSPQRWRLAFVGTGPVRACYSP
jgi:hypothetical protein